MLAVINALSQVSKASPHQRLSASFFRVSDHAPSVKHTCLTLLLCSDYRHTMKPTIEVLFFHPAEPFCECIRRLEVSHLGAELVDDFKADSPRMHIVLPHIKAQFKFSSPEIREFTLNNVELTSLLLSEAIADHPLFELSIEN